VADKDKENVILAVVYNVNLSRVYWGRRTNRADRAVKYLRKFIARHTKADRVLVTNEVNNYIWSRGREKPPRRISVFVKVVEEKEEEEEEEEKATKRVAKVYLASKKRKPGKVEVAAEKK